MSFRPTSLAFALACCGGTVACTALLGSFELASVGAGTGGPDSSMTDGGDDPQLDGSLDAPDDASTTDASTTDGSIPRVVCTTVDAPKLAYPTAQLSSLRTFRVADRIRIFGNVAEKSSLVTINGVSGAIEQARELNAHIMDGEKTASDVALFVVTPRTGASPVGILRLADDDTPETLTSVTTGFGTLTSTGAFAVTGSGDTYAWKIASDSTTIAVYVRGDTVFPTAGAAYEPFGLIPDPGTTRGARLLASIRGSGTDTQIVTKTGSATTSTSVLAGRLLARPQMIAGTAALAFAVGNTVRIGRVAPENIAAVDPATFGTPIVFPSANDWPSGANASYQWQGTDLLAVAPTASRQGVNLFWFDGASGQLVATRTILRLSSGSSAPVVRAALTRGPSNTLDLVWEEQRAAMDASTESVLYVQSLVCR